MKRTPARIVALAAATLLLVGAAAVPLVAAVSDNELPGVPLPASPVTGSLSDFGLPAQQDYDDIYAIVLDEGDKLEVEMTGASGTDFDLQLFKPGTPPGDPDNLTASQQRTYVVQASSTPGTSTEEFWYPVSQPGTYSIDVVNFDGKGTYRLEWKVSKLPSPGLVTAVPAYVEWGASAKLVGTVTVGGQPVKSAPVMIQQRAVGTSKWTSLNKGSDGWPRLKTSSAGAFSYTVKPAQRMEYRAWVWPTRASGWVEGVEHPVSPRAYLTTPSTPSSVKAKSSFSVSGYLAPKHRTGDKDVKLTFYRWISAEKTWKKIKTVRATNQTSKKHSTQTRYYAKTSLPTKGSWKVEASIAGDSTHAEKTSGARKLTVK